MEPKKVFTQSNILDAIIQFAIPGVITILMAELYNMIDTFFVGRYAGSVAIGAMSIAFPVQRMIIALSLMIGVGSATAVSRSLGENNKKKMQETIGSSIFLGIVILALVPLTVYLFPEFILQGLGARGVIYSLGKSYVDIVVLGSFFLGFTNILGYQMTALGNPKITLISTTIGTVINIGIDFIFVAKMGMGVEGAAVATLFSQMIACGYTFVKISQYRAVHSFSIRPQWNKSVAYSILSIGFATFIVEISDAVLIASLNNILLPIGGNDAVIIVGAITRVSMFMYITIVGISAGMQPLVAYSYGAGDFERISKIVKITSMLVLGTSLLLWGGIMIFAREIMGSFMKDTVLLVETVKIFRFTIMIFPVISLYYVCIYYCQSVGKARLGFLLSIYRQLLLFIPIVILLTRIMGIRGAWLTYPITDGLSALTGIYFLHKN